MKTNSLIREKLQRLRDGGNPRVLDLFSGCGGLFLGFHRAGSLSIGGVEIDSAAALSYAVNFHGRDPENSFAEHATTKDICSLSSDAFLRRLGHKTPSASVDIIVGGPPCPAFARVGRAKLREIHKHPDAFLHDPRGKLYLHYLRVVRELRPVAMLMENVPDVLNYGGTNLGEDICELLEEMGYVCTYTILNAASYGVPQLRERFFLMAIHEEANVLPTFPDPTCRVEIPLGYEGSRRVALKNLRERVLWDSNTRYIEVVTPRKKLPPCVPVEAAIGDLPPITRHLFGEDRRGARRFVNSTPYKDSFEPSQYAESMREWPGFRGDGLLYDHVTRCLTDRDYRLFREMQPGDEYPQAYELALRLFEAELVSKFPVRRPRRGSAEYDNLRARYVPPYDARKFPNKWRKMESDKPARTLMAHLGKDSYSHIHYDSAQARVVTVREAARLQSFPDGFLFVGTMNPAFRQIGNSVPPLLSYALAKALLTSIGAKAKIDSSTEIADLKRRRELAAKLQPRLAS